MSKKCKAYSVSKLGLEPADNRKAFYAGWDAALAVQPAIKQDLTPGQHQCNFPLCQSEDYQQALAEQIKRELYTGEPAQRKPMTDEEIERIYDRYGGNMMNCVRAIERAHGIKGGK